MGNARKTSKLRRLVHLLFHVTFVVISDAETTPKNIVYPPRRIAELNADFIIGGLFPVHVIEKNASKCEEGKDSRYLYMSSVFGGKDCYKINLSGLMWVEAMLYAINEINNNPRILPNKKLGYVISDSGNSAYIAMNATLDYIYNADQVMNSSENGSCLCSKFGRRVTAIIGGAGSKISRTVSYILGVDNIPQISYSSTSPSLSDKLYFPSFLRTIPSDLMQAEVMADLVSYFNWTYVSTIATDEDYGRIGIQAFKKAIKSRNVCISVDELFHSDIRLPETKTKITEIVQKLKTDKKANVIVLFSETPSALAVIEEAQRLGLKGKTWIGTEAWGDKSDVLPFEDGIIGGMLGVLPWKGNIEKFESYMAKLTPLNTSHNPWFADYWEGNFGCEFDNEEKTNANLTLCGNANSTQFDNRSNSNYLCRNKTSRKTDNSGVRKQATGKESPLQQGKSIKCSKHGRTFVPTAAHLQLNKAPNVMDAVYTVALALHNMLNCNKISSLLGNGKCPKILNGTGVNPSQLLAYIKNLTFTRNLGYPVEFDKNGDTKGKDSFTDLSCTFCHIMMSICWGLGLFRE